MARGVSKKYLKLKDKLLSEQPDNLGLQLGDLSHKAGIPPVVLAPALQVAVTSVYRWTRGSEPRKVYKPAIRKVMAAIQYGLTNNLLPPNKGVTAEAALIEAITQYKRAKLT